MKRRALRGRPLLVVAAGATTINMAGCFYTSANLVALPPNDAGIVDAGPTDAGPDAGDAPPADAGPDAGSDAGE